MNYYSFKIAFIGIMGTIANLFSTTLLQIQLEGIQHVVQIVSQIVIGIATIWGIYKNQKKVKEVKENRSDSVSTSKS